MNEHDLGLGLRAIHRERADVADVEAMRQHVLAAPIQDLPQQRSWLSRIETGGYTMFSAVKLIAAGVIVALFGSFLLAGVLTTPQGDEMAPAAVMESPSPVATSELLSGMWTQEVEPGVLRVINDGVRDLVVTEEGTPNGWLTMGPDDDIWVFQEGRAFRLGDDGQYVWEDHAPWAYEIAPDGTLWGITFDSAITSLEGGSWTERARLEGRQHATALAIAPDGTAWATATDEGACPDDSSGPNCRQTILVREDQDGLSIVEGWQDVHPGRLGWHTPVVSPERDLWLVGVDDSPPSYSVEAFLRYDGSTWHSVDVPDGLRIADMGESFAFAPDGTLWAAVGPTDTDWSAHTKDGLARLDESGWTIFTEADGVRPWGGQFWFATDYLRVAPDGSVWVNAVVGEMGCDGVASFDGRTWTPYLQGHCIDDFDIASDGSVWVRASNYLYVITPETAA